MFYKHNYPPMGKEIFWNRIEELARLQRLKGKGQFAYITGRRRVGKTALLRQVVSKFGGIYHQAVEGTAEQQLDHLVEETRDALPIFRGIMPKTWSEFFQLLSREKLPSIIVFDEFPYWVQGDSSLPSILQKWIDHHLEKSKTLILVSGSSQSMLNSQFLERGAPLYGRAALHLHLEPMSYAWFCRALKYDVHEPDSFVRFSLVGGIPHYWKLIPQGTVIDQAQELYFEPSALLAEEPVYWLRDEGITGTLPKAMLDLIGRGVSKPAEIAGRLNTAHGNLSRPLALLLDLGFIQREIPFGETPRSTKRSLYSIQDPSLAFYYGTFLASRSRWFRLTPSQKIQLLHLHTSQQWENFCRRHYPDGSRYWDGQVEIDLVGSLEGEKEYLVAECKWAKLKPREETALLEDLKTRFSKTWLSRKLKKVRFKIFSQKDLCGDKIKS